MESTDKTKIALDGIKEALQKMRDAKLDERSELSRRYAVAITEMEKVYAYFQVYIAFDGFDDS